MCTTVIAYDPAAAWPIRAAVVRDEFADRVADPPGRWWPERPGLVAGRARGGDGSWFAVDLVSGRLATLVNGVGRCARRPVRSRGELPVRAVAGTLPGNDEVARYDPFRLLTAGPDGLAWHTYGGGALRSRPLDPGLRVLTYRGVDEASGHPRAERWRAEFAAALPEPRLMGSANEVWAPWVGLFDTPDDPGASDALLVRRQYGGRPYISMSVTLVAISPGAVRIDHLEQPLTTRDWRTCYAGSRAAELVVT